MGNGKEDKTTSTTTTTTRGSCEVVVRGEEDDDDDDDDGQGLVPIHDSYNKRSSITEKKSVYTTVPMIAAALLCVDVTA
jgi:hypothetical protein